MSKKNKKLVVDSSAVIADSGILPITTSGPAIVAGPGPGPIAFAVAGPAIVARQNLPMKLVTLVALDAPTESVVCAADIVGAADVVADAAAVSGTKLPRDDYTLIKTMRCYFPTMTKEQTERFFKEEMRYLIRPSNSSEPLVNCERFTISFYRASSKEKLNHIRIHVRPGVGICIDQSFEERRTFQTVSALLTQQLRDHNQNWGHLLRPHGYADEPTQLPVLVDNKYFELNKVLDQLSPEQALDAIEILITYLQEKRVEISKNFDASDQVPIYAIAAAAPAAPAAAAPAAPSSVVQNLHRDPAAIDSSFSNSQPGKPVVQKNQNNLLKVQPLKLVDDLGANPSGPFPKTEKVFPLRLMYINWLTHQLIELVAERPPEQGYQMPIMPEDQGKPDLFVPSIPDGFVLTWSAPYSLLIGERLFRDPNDENAPWISVSVLYIETAERVFERPKDSEYPDGHRLVIPVGYQLVDKSTLVRI